MKEASNPMPVVVGNVDILLETIRARDLFLQKKYETTRQICSHVVASKKWARATNATKAYVLTMRGSAFSLLQQNDAAMEDFEQVLELEPENYMVLSQKAEILLSMKKLEEAKACYDIVIENQLVVSSGTYVNRASLLLQLKDTEGALRDAQSALKLAPNSQAALQNAGLAYNKLKNAEGTLECASRLLALDPKSGIGHYLNGTGNVQLQNNAAAIEDFGRAIEGNYNFNGTVNNLRAAVYLMSKKYDECINDCDRSLKMNENNLSALRLKTQALLLLQRGPEALEILRRELELSKDAEPKAKASIHLKMCNAYLKMDDTSAALQASDIALDYAPDDPVALNQRAWILANLNKLNEALVHIEKACAFLDDSTLAETMANVLSTRGFINFYLGRMDEARALFESALAKNPALGESLFYRGVIFQRAGDLQSAKAYFEREEALKFKLPAWSILSLPEDGSRTAPKS